MKSFEDEILYEINTVRSNPRSYHKKLESNMQKLRNGELVLYDTIDSIVKIKNIRSGLELLNDLKTLRELSKFNKSDILDNTSKHFLDKSISEEVYLIDYLSNVTSNTLVKSN